MLTFTSLCLLCFLQFNKVKSNEVPLGLHEESIDDRYSTCKEKMEKLVFDKFSKELTMEGYGTQWNNEKNKIEKTDEILTKKELLAIRVYTENEYPVYSEFNKAVRTGKNVYGTSFKFHILHFLLASAIQKLKTVDRDVCYTTYRRNSLKFKKMTDEMRFGNFASSSQSADQKKYGKDTCFKIQTCLGALVEKYSAYPEEKEVLIPPYEKFTFVNGEDVPELKDCEIVYVLKSAGTRSNLDCNLFK